MFWFLLFFCQLICQFSCQFLWAQDSNVHLQTTVVSQEHDNFPAKYSGTNSLSSGYDQQTSTTLTVFLGHTLWHNSEFYIDPELAGGSGFDGTHGLAGFSNGEIYRVDDPSPKWNLARMYLKQIFEFGGNKEEIKDDKNQLPEKISEERFTIAVGKFALDDFIDVNTYSHDPRTQFLNWALMDFGAWDYAADTRGYSWGLYLEYNRADWAIRFASVMVPVRANQLELSKNFPQYRGDNLEFEYRYREGGVARLMAYENHADMGNYRETIDTPSYGMDVTKTRAKSVKYGFGLGLEQALSKDLGLFSRLSWNDGKTETWNFTEIEQSLSLGASLKASSWKRPDDRLGLAFVVNGLNQDHRDYLAAGGIGFMIGDGALNYAPEEIGELYYLFNFIHGLDVTGDYQFVQHPAYNSDRGPVSIFSLRMHYEI